MGSHLNGTYLYVLRHPHRRVGDGFKAGDAVLVRADTAAWLNESRVGDRVINPTLLQIEEARHLALMRQSAGGTHCCMGR